MTREQQVRELCRQIRGIAMNYPQGMQAIIAATKTTPHVTSTAAVTSPVSQEDTHTSFTGEPAPTPVAPPNSPRRGPGRPRKVRTEG